ncbi:helix-turn-helix domain-containing protein [Xylanimonas ulmi]|uniref:helix-turn-helix domain-containing protein n=1 Tax=Xylanimonas ulmi TaxID=228973 RepID=UPI0013EE4E8B|nr:AraC family transcriptional regulator [Xylanibacterium ulmi]
MSCPSIYATTQPGGKRMIRTLAGAEGLATFGADTVRRADRARFKWRYICARYGPLDIGLAQFTPHTRQTPGDNFGHDHPVSRLMITLEGTQTVTVTGHELVMAPGAGILIPGDVPASYEASSVAARLHVDIAADHPGFAPLLKNAHCGYWPPKTPLLIALSAFVGTLLRRSDHTQTWADRTAVRSTLEAMICATISSAPPVLSGEEQVLGHRQQALQYIRTHHADPALTPGSVAQGLGMSVRTLQRAFAGDKNVSQWIADFRLESGLAFLRDPNFADLTLPEIATRAGFGSTVALRRGVLAATGLPPSAYRERHVGAARAAEAQRRADGGGVSYLPPAHPGPFPPVRLGGAMLGVGTDALSQTVSLAEARPS